MKAPFGVNKRASAAQLCQSSPTRTFTTVPRVLPSRIEPRTGSRHRSDFLWHPHTLLPSTRVENAQSFLTDQKTKLEITLQLFMEHKFKYFCFQGEKIVFFLSTIVKCNLEEQKEIPYLESGMAPFLLQLHQDLI